jgi:hypothetical protein
LLAFFVGRVRRDWRMRKAVAGLKLPAAPSKRDLCFAPTSCSELQSKSGNVKSFPKKTFFRKITFEVIPEK